MVFSSKRALSGEQQAGSRLTGLKLDHFVGCVQRSLCLLLNHRHHLDQGF